VFIIIMISVVFASFWVWGRFLGPLTVTDGGCCFGWFVRL